MLVGPEQGADGSAPLSETAYLALQHVSGLDVETAVDRLEPGIEDKKHRLAQFDAIRPFLEAVSDAGMSPALDDALKGDWDAFYEKRAQVEDELAEVEEIVFDIRDDGDPTITIGRYQRDGRIPSPTTLRLVVTEQAVEQPDTDDLLPTLKDKYGIKPLPDREQDENEPTELERVVRDNYRFILREYYNQRGAGKWKGLLAQGLSYFGGFEVIPREEWPQALAASAQAALNYIDALDSLQPGKKLPTPSSPQEAAIHRAFISKDKSTYESFRNGLRAAQQEMNVAGLYTAPPGSRT